MIKKRFLVHFLLVGGGGDRTTHDPEHYSLVTGIAPAVTQILQGGVTPLYQCRGVLRARARAAVWCGVLHGPRACAAGCSLSVCAWSCDAGVQCMDSRGTVHGTHRIRLLELDEKQALA